MFGMLHLPGAALGNFATSGTGGTYANVISGTSKYVEISRVQPVATLVTYIMEVSP